MLNKIRKSWIAKVTSLTLVVSLLAEIVAPTAAYALTSGPSQPEVQSFEPIATTDMVDLFSGDFNYNIPIMQVGHYPINLFYHAGIGMDQESSWTGLGWNINPGVINRNMRGIPDDFNGDPIEKTLNIKSDVTVGLRVGLKLETLGYQVPANINFSLKYNNYKGIGYGVGLGLSDKSGALGLSLELGNTEGVSIGLSFEKEIGKASGSGKGELSLGYNSRSGLKSLTLTQSHSVNNKYLKKARGGSMSVINFLAPTFTPTTTPKMASFLGSLRVAIGAEASVALAGASIAADIQVHGLTNKNPKKYPTAGYLYAENNTDPGILQDYNREKEVPINKFTNQLHTTNHAYDTYAVSGQGTGGMYRPYRGNVGMIFDPVTDNSNAEGFAGVDLSLGIELGAGFLAEIGADINTGVSLSYMGPWESDFEPFNELQFTSDPQNSDIFHEPVYFKTVGEKTTVDQDFYDKIMDTKAVDFPLNSDFFDTKAKKQFRDKNGATEAITSDIFRAQRDRRNQHISYLTAEEAGRVGFDRLLKFYEGTNEEPTPYGRASNGRASHHISEIVVTNPDGSRYVYGLPAYNYKQEEYSFSVDVSGEIPLNVLEPATGLVTYEPSDITTENNKGRDHYFSKEVTPPYAYAYLLTAVLSPDYVDVNDNGISEDDWGTYTKINYFRADDNYKWRTPYSSTENIANYNRGLKSDTKDDKASFVYGTKEIFYVHSIETKTQTAEFILNSITTDVRKDVKGADGIGGGRDNDQSLRHLKEIMLYSKPDRITNGSNAVPIKTAHFSYDYSLCKNSPNNSEYVNEIPAPANSGKLTLTNLNFTYGKNISGSLSPYAFEYNGLNEVYSIKGSDRWGNYKANTPSLPNTEFPYSVQGKTTADLNASAWNLTGINLPSGGHIEVDYEGDDYSFVQNRRAGIMTKVMAVTDSEGEITGSALYDYNDPHPYIHFDINEEKYNDVDWTAAEAATDMMDGVDTLYFNFGVKLSKTDKEEVVTGYVAVDSYGGYGSGTGKRGWVKVKDVEMGTGWDSGRGVNPIAKAAWQFARIYRPGLAYEGSDWTETEQVMSFNDIVWGVLSSVSSICNMIAGFNQMMEAKGKGRIVNLERSWLRLNAPESGKLGGGHRVTAINFTDNWDEMTANQGDEPQMTYGQKFEYKLIDGTTSSGVASYEPLIGGDENPFRVPLAYYSFDRALAPDDDHYVEGPIGEQFFPGPSVGYSMVTVTNIKPVSGINRHGSGKTVHEFYTAKEFPVYTESTPFDPIIKPVNPILSFLNVYTREYATASQGFAIELNDMHGKQKAVTVYAEDVGDQENLPVPIVSQVKYFYKVENENLSSKQLKNQVYVMDKEGVVSTANVGKDIEMVVDTKEKSDYDISIGMQINTDMFTAGPIPMIIPIPWPDISVSKRRLRYAVNTKVVNRFGILEHTEATQNGGATISTWNEVYDKETGEVLLTRTVNEHYDNSLNNDEDFIYNFNYPAHWAYDQMGPAYKNSGVKGLITIGNGVTPYHGPNVAVLNLTIDDDKILYEALVPGDEIMLTRDGTITKAWVLSKVVDTAPSPDQGLISFIDKNGDPSNIIGPHEFDFKVIRSGRRNQQTTSVGSVVSKQSPIVSNALDVSLGTEILNSAATVYSDEWQTPADKGIEQVYTYDCDLGTDGDDLTIFLNDMEDVNFDENTPEIYPSPPDFMNLTEGCTLKYTAAANPSYVLIQLFEVCAASILQPGCQFLIILPDGVDPEDIVSFSDEITYSTQMEFPNSGLSALYGQPNYITLFTAGDEYLVELFINEWPYSPADCDIYFEQECDEPVVSVTECGSTNTEFVNPYLNGLSGIWRPKKGYAYNSSRHYAGTGNSLNSRLDGYYDDFDPFWRPNVDVVNNVIHDWKLPDEIENPDPDDNKWVWTSEVTKYHPAGYEVENKDALGRYSSALFNYWYTQPSALASNAQYREIAFDGFEDYGYQEGYGPGTCHYLDHWSFMDAIDPVEDLYLDTVHTGRKSLQLEADEEFSVTRKVVPASPYAGHDDFMEQYPIMDIDKLGLFSPYMEGSYLLGLWVHKSGHSGQVYSDVKINVHYLDNEEPPNVLSSQEFDMSLMDGRPEVEGWKRFEAIFEVPDSDVDAVRVELKNENVYNIFVDDIRIHPFNSNMKTFVYDPVSLRLVAQLDENNYATLYEYDDQGNLIRTKKETERGIVTLQENRQNIHKITP